MASPIGYGLERACSGPTRSRAKRRGPPPSRFAPSSDGSSRCRSSTAIRGWTQQPRALPESSLGKAIAYMLGLWPGLTHFLHDARIPLDHNATERGLRGLVVGRKNHYGSRSQRGTEVAALFYSLIE